MIHSPEFPQITASYLMTPKENWSYCLEEDWSSDKCRNYIREAREKDYDMLPVLNKEQRVLGFVWTKSGEFQPLSLSWCLTHDTPFERVLKYFSDTDRPVCFLLHADDIVGLITPADFNRMLARVAIYVKIAELELLFLQAIRSLKISEEEILENLGKRKDKILEHYKELKKKNVEVDLLESLYFSDFFALLEKIKAFREKLGLSRTEVKKYTGLVELRNCEGHPIRPILKEPGEIKHLSERLERLNDLTKRLKKYISRKYLHERLAL